MTRVRAGDADRLGARCASRGIRSSRTAIRRPARARHAPEAVGAVAAEHGIALSELVAVARSLEDAFLELTAEAA